MDKGSKNFPFSSNLLHFFPLFRHFPTTCHLCLLCPSIPAAASASASSSAGLLLHPSCPNCGCFYPQLGLFAGSCPQNRPDLRTEPCFSAVCPQNGVFLRIASGFPTICPQFGLVLRTAQGNLVVRCAKMGGICAPNPVFSLAVRKSGPFCARAQPVLGAHRRSIRFPAAPAGNQLAGKVVGCRCKCLGAPPPPITIVGGCTTDDFESRGGSQNRPLAARLSRQHQATGVASRVVRWVERSEVRTSGPTRSRDFGEDKVGKGLERRRGLQGAEPPS